jgi:hypothetical protein
VAVDGDGALSQVMPVSAHEDDAGLTMKPLWRLADVSDRVAVAGAVASGLWNLMYVRRAGDPSTRSLTEVPKLLVGWLDWR